MLGNRDDAEDAAQHVFLNGFTGINRLRDSGQFGAWIAQIARNFCTDFIRRKNRKPDAAVQPPRSDPGEQDRYIELKVALAKLPAEYRVVLMLYYFDGRTTQSVARILGISDPAVHTRLSRARKQLRRLLETEGDML
jgi:RNA polymerase sigma-70 factor (ECF subfamily)